MKTLSAPPGLEIGLARRRPSVGAGIRVDESAVRRLGALAPVSAVPVAPGSRRIQYWMLNGIVREADAARVERRLCFDFTYLPDRPVGWERAKTFGHAHGRPSASRLGFAEIMEVHEGTAGFLVQDLLSGPRATFAALVVGRPGERIVMPPFLSHAAVNLAGDPVVFSDVIDRRVVDRQLPSDYGRVAAAHGMAWYVDLDGEARPNPAYRDVPELRRFSAAEWSGVEGRRPLYVDYVEDPGGFDWLVEPDLFPERFPLLWSRVAGVAVPPSDA